MTHQIEVIVGTGGDLNKSGVEPGHAEVYFQFLIDCSGISYAIIVQFQLQSISKSNVNRVEKYRS